MGAWKARVSHGGKDPNGIGAKGLGARARLWNRRGPMAFQQNIWVTVRTEIITEVTLESRPSNF